MTEVEKRLRSKILEVSDETQKQIALKMRGWVWQKVWHPVRNTLARANLGASRDLRAEATQSADKCPCGNQFCQGA